MATTNVMTAENLQKLQDELKEIRTVKMKENSEKIKEARGQGDLSENAEYDAAKDEIDTSSINLGSTVKVLDVEFDEEITYKLVPSIEADSEKGTISIESPLGQALMKHKTGDTVTVEAPVGEIEYKILDFTAPNLG